MEQRSCGSGFLVLLLWRRLRPPFQGSIAVVAEDASRQQQQHSILGSSSTP